MHFSGLLTMEIIGNIGPPAQHGEAMFAFPSVTFWRGS